MKIIILQDVPYRFPEGALAQYHGAIWAEELRRRGHEATKMVIGNPKTTIPESSLLSLSTYEQRIDPTFWHGCDADIVLSYGGFSQTDLRVAHAVKTGSPRTLFIARIEGYTVPCLRSVKTSIEEFFKRYVIARHCPTETFKRENAPIMSAFVRALAKTVQSIWVNPSGSFLSLAETADVVTLFFPQLVDRTKAFLHEKKRDDLAHKIHWCGYPVRSEFKPPVNGVKRRGSIISVANWRHFKDPDLTAKAVAIVLRTCPESSYTVIGLQSSRVRDRILSEFPEAASRVFALDHIDNWKVHEYMAESQVFLLCSHREGVPSVLSEALCCGCSLALSTGPAVGAFRQYLSSGDCGTQARSRNSLDMANALSQELNLWEQGVRSAAVIGEKWGKTHVANLCDDLFSFCENHRKAFYY